MSHASHESDRTAAYRGLILGAIALLVIVYSIVQFTNRLFAGEGSKAEATTPK